MILCYLLDLWVLRLNSFPRNAKGNGSLFFFQLQYFKNKQNLIPNYV